MIKIFLFLLLFSTGKAFAAGGAGASAIPLDDISIMAMITHSMAPAANILLTQSVKWLAIFASLQWVITNFSLLKNGSDIQEIFAKLIGSIAWISFCVYLMNNGPAFIGHTGHEFFDLLGIDLPSPGKIMESTTALVASLAVIAAGVGFANTTSGMLVVYILIGLFGAGMFFAARIFMLQLELGLIVLMAPLSFSFLGLKALHDQGIAPFKALISLGYRVLLMTLILSAFTEVGDVVVETLKGFTIPAIITNGIGSFVSTILAALGAYIMLVYILYKSDAIAASLSSGSTNMGTGDLATAAAAGAAAGAAIASGGASVAAGATKAGQPMSDFIKSLSGGSSMQNDSGSGRGGFEPVGSAPVAPAKPPEMSLQELRSHPSAIENQEQSAQSATSANQSPSSSLGGAPSPSASPTQSSSGSGSATTAGIGGASNGTDQKLDKLIDSMSKPTQKPSFGDRLSNLNDHVAKEQAATHVSINTNHHD
jgi:type IV secretion system protein TrbL